MNEELEAAQQQVSLLVRDLVGVAKGNLVMAALYGSVVHGDFTGGRSDINLLLVFDNVGVGALREVSELLQNAMLQIHCAPFVLSRDDLVHGGDVFPIKFHEIRRFYEVVHGQDLLAGLNLDFHDLRLSCERELRNAALELRRTWLLERPRPGPLVRALRTFLPPTLGVLRVVLEHDGFDANTTSDVLLGEIARRFAVDLDGLRSAIEASHDRDGQWQRVEAAYEVVLGLLDHASRHVDGWTKA